MRLRPYLIPRLTVMLFVFIHAPGTLITNHTSAGQMAFSNADALRVHSNGSSIVGDLLKQNSVHCLSIGDRDFPLLFEDVDQQPVDEVVKAIVSSDFNLVYGHFTKCQFSDKTLTRLTVGGIEIDITQYLHLDGRGRITPKAHQGRAKMISDIDGTLCVIIPKELTEEYRKAKTFREFHSLAFSRLEELFRDFRSGRIRDPDHYTPSELVYLGTTQIARLTTEYLGRELLKVNVRQPSFVDVFIVTENEAHSSGLPRGSIGVKAVTLDKTGLPDGYVPCIYYNEKWRFLPPTGM